jgi:uncharacterized protein YndB with AHSA1/START domain
MATFVQVGAIDASSSPGPGDGPVRDRAVASEHLVHVQLMLNSSVGAVWHVLISPEGTAAWLGDGAVLGEKGQSYHCADGSAGAVRSFHPLEQLRLSWHRDAETEPSLIELDVTAVDGGTRLRLWHEGLPEAEREAMKKHWQYRLIAMAELGGWPTFIES